jgi:aminoglycoside N3'-acetyltransferase
MAGAAQTDQGWMERHLAALGVSAARPRLVVHSRLWSFGKLAGGLAALHAALLAVAGADATIAVPAYTTGLGPGDAYDPATTPPEGMGAYTGYVLSLPGRVRSLCPIHNHAAIGPLAGDLPAAAVGDCSIGPGSDFEWFFDADFDLLLLGCGFAQGATYLHHMEAMVDVPYRRWVTLDRRVVGPDGTVRPAKLRYYARDDDGLVEDFGALESRLVASGDVAREPAPYGASLLVPVRRLHALTAAALAADPCALVKARAAAVQ